MDSQDYRAIPVAMLGALAAAIVGGLAVGIAIVGLFFENTRTQGYVVLVIAFLSVGLFINVVGFTRLVSKHLIPNKTLIAAQSVVWICLALLFTKFTCDQVGITLGNVGYILSSWEMQFAREYVQSIILGWGLISAAGLAAAFVSRKILEYR